MIHKVHFKTLHQDVKSLFIGWGRGGAGGGGGERGRWRGNKKIQDSDSVLSHTEVIIRML